MKNLVKSCLWVRFVMVAILVTMVLGLALRKPLLIAYHRDAMISIWQTELGISQPKGLVVSVRQFLGLPVTRNSNSQAAVLAFPHREALLNLGYFTKHRFDLPTVAVGTPDYQKLCDRVAAQTGQTPTAQFDYDQPVAPSRVLGLFVYATPSEMSRWEQFITNLGHFATSAQLDRAQSEVAAAGHRPVVCSPLIQVFPYSRSTLATRSW